VIEKIFTDLTLPREIEEKLETRYWDCYKEHLIYELGNLSSYYPISQSTSEAFNEVYNRLIEMNQKRKLPEKTIREMDRCKQKLKKLTDKTQFSNLSEKAMNPNVVACFSYPGLNENDIQLVGKWCCPPRNNIDKKSLIEDKSKDRELARLLSARSAEKVAILFCQQYGEVKDVSITQINKKNNSNWKAYDLSVDGAPIDVKNSRRSQKSKDRYTEHCIPKFKYNRDSQEVAIAGVLSPYLWTFELLDKPTKRHEDAEILFLGETTLKKQQALKREFKDLVDSLPNTSSNYSFLPPWVFDYPQDVYVERDRSREQLKDFSDFDLLKEATFDFNIIPVVIAAGMDLTKILDGGALGSWERNFLDQLSNRTKKYGLSLPFLFLTILEHFLDMAKLSKTASDFKPRKYRKFLFYKKQYNKPLGIYDPLNTIDSLIKALNTLWLAENELIRKFCKFKLKSFNILQGKSPSNNSWITLIAYCGGRLSKNGSACGKNPLVLGESKLCEYRRLRCPECGYCCDRCKNDKS